MKKKLVILSLIVAILLTSALCLVACGKSDIVGTWVSADGLKKVVFNEDGTGEADYNKANGVIEDFTWTYSEDNKTYKITYNTGDFAFSPTLKKGVLTIGEAPYSTTYTKE